MSATGRGAIRRESDYYPTPPWAVESMLDWMKRHAVHHPGLPLVDICAGDGAICRTVREHGLWRPMGIELHERFRPSLARACAIPAEQVTIADSLQYAGTMATNPLFGVLTNTPFDGFERFIARWVPGRSFAAFLLRINALGGQERAAFWRKHPPDTLCILPRRVAFVAVCKGLSATKTRKRAKNCGRSYPLGTRGDCECGSGRIADGTDSCEYAWFVYAPKAVGLRAVYHLEV